MIFAEVVVEAAPTPFLALCLRKELLPPDFPLWAEARFLITTTGLFVVELEEPGGFSDGFTELRSNFADYFCLNGLFEFCNKLS